MPEVVTLGEALVDCVPETLKPGRPSAGFANMRYALNPGGAPSNVAVNLSRLGIKSAIISRVGCDFLGDLLIDFLKKNNVDISNISRTDRAKTGLVFVFVNRYKDRDFSFYGDPSADKFLAASDIKEKTIKNCKIFHYGSIGMMAKSSGSAAMKAVLLAKKYGKIISYDPNVRLNLWEGRAAQAKGLIRSYFKYADVIKLSDTELKFLFNARPGPEALGNVFGNKLVFVSAGRKGCYLYYRGFFRHVPGYDVKAVDSTGAGDAFMAGALYGIIKAGKGLALGPEELVKIARFANKMGSEAVTHKGAV